MITNRTSTQDLLHDRVLLTQVDVVKRFTRFFTVSKLPLTKKVKSKKYFTGEESQIRKQMNGCKVVPWVIPVLKWTKVLHLFGVFSAHEWIKRVTGPNNEISEPKNLKKGHYESREEVLFSYILPLFVSFNINTDGNKFWTTWKYKRISKYYSNFRKSLRCRGCVLFYKRQNTTHKRKQIYHDLNKNVDNYNVFLRL